MIDRLIRGGAMAVAFGLGTIAQGEANLMYVKEGTPAIVDNPGFCEAPGEEQELVDLAFLAPDGIYSHSESCTWIDTPLSYVTGLEIQVDAKCDDGAGQWAAPFEITVNARGRVHAAAYAQSSLSGYYFPCEQWGWKGDDGTAKQ
ncbi:hypothetical protein [Roseovarius sp. E0-M6]|uniref:hypothetical protein n=1 Tax=Roseovarius sp. E0-M6 TaxID=3127118 RepID=UPI00300FC67C